MQSERRLQALERATDLPLLVLAVAAIVLASCSEASEVTPATSTETRGSSPAIGITVRTGPRPTAAATTTATPTLAGIACQWARVSGVTDGDTIQVVLEGGGAQSLRLIGIDSPERNQPFFAEALAEAERLLGRGRVCLEKDVSERDTFGRLLRYVWLEDGRLANELLVASGAAAANSYPPDVKHQQVRLDPAEQQARAARVGLWSVHGLTCDPSYPDVCIPPPPPDLDCADITFRRFRVLPPDPHRFDPDRNGLGCN